MVYIESLAKRVLGEPLERVRIASPFVVRSVTPSIREVEGKIVRGLRRIGKRIVLSFEGDLHLVIHLMIAGRLRFKERGAPIPGKVGLAAFDFPTGTLIFTEASPKKRASLHLVSGEEALRAFDRGGIEPLEVSLEQFREALLRENHTIKRTLTDPTLLSGIGNAYSDEILHRAKLSPVKWTTRLTDEEIARLYNATRETLIEWTDLLREQVGDDFPDKVTAFRPEMATHGRYRKPCPVCGTPIQRIVHADNETNYCPTCQTEGKLLADRALSRILKTEWPGTLDELEANISKRKQSSRKKT